MLVARDRIVGIHRKGTILSGHPANSYDPPPVCAKPDCHGGWVYRRSDNYRMTREGRRYVVNISACETCFGRLVDPRPPMPYYLFLEMYDTFKEAS